MTKARRNKVLVDSKTIALTALKMTERDLLPAALLCIWTSNLGTLEELKEEIDKAIEESIGSIPF